MTSRRTILQAVGSAALLLGLRPVLAQGVDTPGLATPGLEVSASGTVIVELANFYCDRCRKVNDHFPRLQRAALAAGVSLRFAPLSWEGQSLWPDRVYYAARDLFPEAEQLTREIIFDGIHREGLAFENLPQVLAHLERRQLPKQALEVNKKFNLAQVAERAAADDVLYSELKAGRLADLSGATEVPVFLWLRDGAVTKVLSPRDASEPLALVQLVQQALSAKSN